MRLEYTGSNAFELSAEVGQNTYNAVSSLPHVFEIGSVEKMRLHPSGSVGIGESSPSGLLHLTGDTNSNGAELFLQVNNDNTTDNLGALHFGNNIDAALNTILGGTSGARDSSYLTFSTSKTGTLSEAMRIDADGAVQIGTIEPQSPAALNLRKSGTNIEFGHANATSGYFGTLGSSGTNGRPYLGFSAYAETGLNTFTTHGFKGNVIQGDNSGNLGFHQLTDADASGQSLTPRMTLDASGKLLVGQTAASTGGSNADDGLVYVNGGVVREGVVFSDFNNVWVGAQGAIIEGRSSFGPLNSPAAESWFGVTARTTETSSANYYITQTATSLTGRIYTRYNNNITNQGGGTGTWTSWVEK
jgi:hypothetical protein